jgi:hypothetical protein
MRRIGVLLRPYAIAGLALSMLSPFFLTGCSESSDARGNVAGQYGLERSEFIALKKSGMTESELKDALTKKKVDELKEKGITGKVLPSGRKATRPR